MRKSKDEFLTFELNGEAHTAPAGSTLGDLAREVGIDPRVLLVEHNGEALPRENWSPRPIAQGDQIEFIRIVAGG